MADVRAHRRAIGRRRAGDGLVDFGGPYELLSPYDVDAYGEPKTEAPQRQGIAEAATGRLEGVTYSGGESAGVEGARETEGGEASEGVLHRMGGWMRTGSRHVEAPTDRRGLQGPSERSGASTNRLSENVGAVITAPPRRR